MGVRPEESLASNMSAFLNEMVLELADPIIEEAVKEFRGKLRSAIVEHFCAVGTTYIVQNGEQEIRIRIKVPEHVAYRTRS